MMELFGVAGSLLLMFVGFGLLVGLSGGIGSFLSALDGAVDLAVVAQLLAGVRVVQDCAFHTQTF